MGRTYICPYCAASGPETIAKGFRRDQDDRSASRPLLQSLQAQVHAQASAASAGQVARGRNCNR